MKIVSLIIVLVLVWSFSACGDTQPTVSNNTAKPASTALPTATVDELARGRKLYSDNCAVCHKESGTGGKIEIEGKNLNVDDLTSEKIKAFADDKIIGYIYNGVPDEGMPAFKDELSEPEIREVVRFVRIGIQKLPASVPAKPARQLP